MRDKKYKFLFIILLISLVYISASAQIISRPNLKTRSGFTDLAADSVFLFPTGNAKPDTLKSYLRKERKAAFFKDTSHKILYTYDPSSNTWDTVGTGNVTGGGGGGNVDQNTKDTSVTFTGATTFVDIPSGIIYTPADISITITAATSSAGDTGQGFTYSFNTTTHVLRIQYGVAPIGTFSYHIVFTKVTLP